MNVDLLSKVRIAAPVLAAFLTTILSSSAMAQFPGLPPGGPPPAFAGPPPVGPGPAVGAGVARGVAAGAVVTGAASGAYAAENDYDGSCSPRYRIRYYDRETGTYFYRCRY